MIKDYNKVIDTYGNKTFKTGLGQCMNARYEIWEDGALRSHYSDRNIALKDWKYIKEAEPPVRQREKMPYIKE